MNSQPERLNEELERMHSVTPAARLGDDLSTGDLEVKRLAALARSLQMAPQLQVDPGFADRLGRRLLARQAVLPHPRSTRRRWGNMLPRPLLARPVLSSALSLCLLAILLSTGILVAAAQVTDPTNPLYALKHWEQQTQASLSGSPVDQTQLDIQTARDQLNALPTLIGTAHVGQYRQTLADFDQQFVTAGQAVAALPSGQDHTRLAGELATLQTDARRVLRSLLLQLAVPERQSTTDALGQLGESVPRVTQVDLTLPAHANGQASISISGDDLQAGAVLLVNGAVLSASGALQDGRYLFTAVWQGEQHPHSIGIMNPDGTVAQTTAITLHPGSKNGSNGGGNGNNGNGGGNGGGNGSGNGGGNGNGGVKPTSTPTPVLAPFIICLKN